MWGPSGGWVDAGRWSGEGCCQAEAGPEDEAR